MSAALQPLTVAEFLAWEERQELRYEFDGIHPQAMTGGTDAHETIGGTLRALLRDRLHGTPCKVRGPTMKIIAKDRVRYPDAFVYCSRVAPDATVITDPVVVFEVLSPGTSRKDRIEKLREYQATESVRRYVILEQDSIAAMMFVRQEAIWDVRALTAQDVLRMPEIGVELPLAEIYADVPPDALHDGELEDAPTAPR